MAVSVFRNFGFLIPKISKIYFFNISKPELFENFQKPVYMLET